MSDMSVGSNEQRMSTPLSNCADTMASIGSSVHSSMAATKIDANSNDIDKKEIKTTFEMMENKTLIPNILDIKKTTETNLPTKTAATATITTAQLNIPPLNPGLNTSGLNSADAAYVNEFYQKISEYYRGIFSKIDIKDPNISSDVLNYYQLIRQFYEQTMAINIQRNTAMGITPVGGTESPKIDANILNAVPSSQMNNIPNLTTPPNVSNDVSSFDLTIHKPPINDPLTFNNIKTAAQFPNNINIGTTNGDDNATKENLIKMNDVHTDDVAENKVTIISAGVSINVSSLNSNSLKISCKTTPPKKRYSVYNHTEDAATVEQRTTPKSMLTTPINLNRKFEAEPMVPTKRTKRDNGIDESPLTKANFMNALNANTFDSNKSSPMTNVETSSSITDIIPITSTYLQLMRSMGFSEEDALKFDNLVSLFFLFFSFFSFFYQV